MHWRQPPAAHALYASFYLMKLAASGSRGRGRRLADANQCGAAGSDASGQGVSRRHARFLLSLFRLRHDVINIGRNAGHG